MNDSTPLSGDLQVQVMQALWRLGSGTVEDVRASLPPRYQGAYTTAQTVLNRLAERGLVDRTRNGRAIHYKPLLSEAQYVSRNIRHALAGASSDARQAVLAELIGTLEQGELNELRRRAEQIEKRRRGS